MHDVHEYDQLRADEWDRLVALETKKSCPECGGTGQDDPPPGKYHGLCFRCDGSGKLRHY